MNPPVQVAYVGDPGVRETIERDLGGRVTLTTVDPHELPRSPGIDCVLCVGTIPEELDREDSPPTLLVTADEEAAREARLAGLRVLPMAVSERLDVLLAQIEAAAERTHTSDVTDDRNATGHGRTTWTLECLLKATRDLMAAAGKREVAKTAVAAANRVLGLAHTGIYLVDDTEERLRPVAYTNVVEASMEAVPELEKGESLAWEVFESGVDQVYENVREEEGTHNPDTHLRGEMIFSLGTHGVLLTGSEDPNAFDDADVYFTKLLAATTETALERAAREGALEEKNARLEEFVGVVSHDLRNPLTVAEGSVSLARETGDDSYLDQVSESHRRMREIIEGLLVLAREGRAVGETQPVVLGTVAEEAWANVGTDDATLVIGENRTVHADRNRLTQLFENAFRNSIEHGSTDGRDSRNAGDSVEHADPDVTITVEATTDGFAIGDDGPGMPESERETLLESSFATEGERGFGTTIMQNIAEGHDWEFSLTESDAGGLRIEITTDGKDHSGGKR